MSESLVGKTVEDEDHGRGTIVGHENGMVFVHLDSYGCRMLVVRESELKPNITSRQVRKEHND